MNTRFRALREALATAEGIQLLPPARPEDVAAFEARSKISLPEEYRTFLLEVGDGILCDDEPVFYSLEVVQEDLGRRDPARPFWYDDAQAKALRDAMAAAGSGVSWMEDRTFMKLQRSEGIPEGCLTVGDNGGNDFSVLVITGEQRCWMWRTGEIDHPEVRHLYDDSGDLYTPLGFLEWFERWAPVRLGVALPGHTG